MSSNQSRHFLNTYVVQPLLGSTQQAPMHILDGLYLNTVTAESHPYTLSAQEFEQETGYRLTTSTSTSLVRLPYIVISTQELSWRGKPQKALDYYKIFPKSTLSLDNRFTLETDRSVLAAYQSNLEHNRDKLFAVLKRAEGKILDIKR